MKSAGFEDGPAAFGWSAIKWSCHAHLPLCPQWPRMKLITRLQCTNRSSRCNHENQLESRGVYGAAALVTSPLRSLVTRAASLQGNRVCQDCRLARRMHRSSDSARTRIHDDYGRRPVIIDALRLMARSSPIPAGCCGAARFRWPATVFDFRSARPLLPHRNQPYLGRMFTISHCVCRSRFENRIGSSPPYWRKSHGFRERPPSSASNCPPVVGRC